MADSHLAPIIIKKRKHGAHAFHGGHWKVALADFMTAMFIVFLLLWLLNQTTPEQREGIADYFSPASVSRQVSGSSGVLGGQSLTVKGPQRNDSAPLGPPGGGPSSPENGEGTTDKPGFVGQSSIPQPDAKEAFFRENRQLEAAQEHIRAAIEAVPELQGFSTNVAFEATPEGLKIELLDNEKRDLFARGSAQPTPPMRALIQQVAKVIDRLPNKLTISGNTDGTPFPAGAGVAYGNWELSADRANASRRLLIGSGIADARMVAVSGKADRELLVPADPTSPRNRRISITLLREHPPVVPGVPSDVNLPPQAPPAPKPGPAPDGRLIPRGAASSPILNPVSAPAAPRG